METKVGILGRPIRVVVFSGGPVLEQGIKRFVCRLQEHPDIEFLGAICQSEAQNLRAVIRDLWRRRRFMAVPLLFVQVVNAVTRFLMRPRAEIKLKRKLAQLSDRVHFVPDIHSDTVVDRVRSLTADLGLIYGSPILKPKLFETPRFGTLGIHHGKVPEYRGKKTTFWAMYNGEPTVGVTIQKINAGLDTGEVVKAGEISVAGKSYRRVWNELEQLGLALYVQAILEIKRGEANFRPQQGNKGKLCRDPKFRHVLVFCWRQLKTLTALRCRLAIAVLKT